MTKLGNVLAGIDLGPGAEHVLQFAASLAKAADRQLTVLHVISPEEQKDRAHDTGVGHFVDFMVTETERTLSDLVDVVGVDGLDFRCVARLGEPVDEILKAGSEAESVVVVGMRRRSRVGKFLLGSDLQEILLAAELPVVVVPIDTGIPSFSADQQSYIASLQDNERLMTIPLSKST